MAKSKLPETLDALRDQLIDGINELLATAKRLTNGEERLSAAMLMSAASALIRERDEYLRGAEITFDYVAALLTALEERPKYDA